MSSWRSAAILLVLFACGWGGVVLTQQRLDTLKPAEGFREIQYLPKGEALKIVAFGFDAPLADLLYLKGLIYWSENARAKAKGAREAGYRYLHDLFDAVTDLNPAFREAYINGGMLVSSTGKERIEAAKSLFEKGLQRYPNDWRFYVNLGSLALIQMKNRKLARHYYAEAAKCPGVPEDIIGAWRGFEMMAIDEEADSPLERYNLQIAQWEAVLADPRSAEEVTRYASRDLARLRTQRAEYLLTQAFQEFARKHDRPPKGLEDFVEAGVLEERYVDELNAFPYYEGGDEWASLPDGRVRSLRETARLVRAYNAMVYNARSSYTGLHGRPPESLQDLVDAGLLGAAPEHPLAPLGYKLVFDPESGELHSQPALPLPPPPVGAG